MTNSTTSCGQSFMLRIQHNRKTEYTLEEGPNTLVLSKTITNNGGNTVCNIIVPGFGKFTGKATCSSRDQYSKKLGRSLAMNRAVGEMLTSDIPISIACDIENQLNVKYNYKGVIEENIDKLL